MKLRRVISGGQTGADKQGLICAKEQGIETGGTAPKGWRTEVGADLTLKEFGLTESPSSGYPMRTAQNVKDSDATIWFGKVGSPGYYCTRNACRTYNKPLYENPGSLVSLALTYEVFNIAGNRESKNPGVIQLVKDAFDSLTRK